MRWSYIFRLTALSLILSSPMLLYGQPKAMVEHYSTEQGLSHDIISCMIKDSDGFIWIGTWDGINKFDGQQFHSFSAARAVMKNTRVDQIMDGGDYLWIRTYDGEVYRFDKAREVFVSLANIVGSKNIVEVQRIISFDNDLLWLRPIHGGLMAVSGFNEEKPKITNFKAGGKNGNRLPSDTVNFLFDHQSSGVYVGTSKGVAKITKKPNGMLSSEQLKIGEFTYGNFSAFTQKDDVVYFGTTNGEIIVYQTKDAAFSTKKLTTAKINYLIPSKKSPELLVTTALGELISCDYFGNSKRRAIYGKGGLYSVFEDRGGSIWLEPKVKGVVRYDRKSGDFETHTQMNDASRISPMNHFKVFEDRNGRVWAVLRDGGFGYYDEQDKKLAYFYNEPGSSNRKLSNLVINVLYDKTGVMFLHTDLRGLDKIVFRNNDFRKKMLVSPGVFKSDNDVRAVLCDNKNRIWVSARSGVLYVYRNDERLNIAFENVPKEGIGSVYTFCQAKNGAVWMGTKEHGLFKAVPMDAGQTRYRLEHYSHDKKSPKSISSNQIYSVIEDLEGNIWAGSYDGGLNLLVKGEGKNGFTRLLHDDGYPVGFHKIRHLALDQSGRIWVGSTGGLVIGQRVAKGKYHFISYGSGNTLSNYDIQYIFKDGLGKMWLGTSGGGLNVWDTKSPPNRLKFRVYNSVSGLDNDYILSISEDHNGALWIATKSAIARLDLKTGKIHNYNSYDGIPNDGYAEASSTITKDGKLVVGTIKGLLMFHPNQIKNYPINAKMVFTKLEINNKEMGIGGPAHILEKNINHTDRIVLDHDQNILSIAYTILDYRDGNRNGFFYRLKGFDMNWQDSRGQSRATYTNLSPGTYTFEVKSAASENYISLPHRSLTILINPPFWKTWWAYLIYVALFVLVFFVLRRIVTTFFHLRQEIIVEQKMSAMKMAFFTNVSHELRTPLTLILNPVEQILKKKELPEQTIEYAKVIQNNAKRMVHFVNQLLDLRKSQSGQAKLYLSTFDINELIGKIVAYFQQEAKDRQVDIKVVSTQHLQMTSDAGKLETVIYNLLGNALKFASAGQKIDIFFGLDEKKDGLLITVRDQGPGVPTDDLETIFQLYHESRNQQTQQFKGTGIGLALARELVELHGGKIWAENRKPKGLSVSLRIPLLPVESTSNNLNFLKAEDIDGTVGPAEVQSSGKPPRTEVKIAEKQSILLVEDNQDMREFLTALLKEKYNVATAVDGVYGLAQAKRLMPDMIVSDVMMPNMNGIQMLDELKNDATTSHIPVILLSAKSALESQIEGLKYGADYYIGKPFDNDFLFAAIESMLKQRRRMFERWVSHKKILEVGIDQVPVTARDEQFLRKAISIIEERLADSDLDIDSIAKQLNMSRTAFFIKFKSLTQQAPVEVVRDMRLKLAKQQLDEGAGNISEVSYAVGFSNAKYFSTCFRAAYGISPTEYIKSIRS